MILYTSCRVSDIRKQIKSKELTKILQKSLKKQLTKRFEYVIMDRLSREGTERSSVERRLKIE